MLGFSASGGPTYDDLSEVMPIGARSKPNMNFTSFFVIESEKFILHGEQLVF
jgi:hypothetical protein